MDPDEAAQKWIEENQDKVDAWLELTTARVRDRRVLVATVAVVRPGSPGRA